MKLALGPVLYLGRADEHAPGAKKSKARLWRFHVALLVQGGDAAAPPVTVEPVGEDVAVGEATVAWDFGDVGGGVYWRWTVEAVRGPEDRRVGYVVRAAGASVEGLEEERRVDDVCVPALGSLPRIAFFSCNGTEQIEAIRTHPDPRALWKDILRRHQGNQPGASHLPGYHLLLGGGDQVYADSLWHKPPLRRYEATPLDAAPTTRLTDEEWREVRRQYVELYAERWSDPEMRTVMARVPGVFTWDDHDIFDGWGSHDERRQRPDNYFGQVFGAARDAFHAFLVGGRGDTLRVRGDRPQFLQAASFVEADRRLDLLVLDLRSGRTPRQVLAPDQWEDVTRWLDGHAAGLGAAQSHLVVVSTIPVVHRRVYRLFSGLDVKGIRDDQLDQWEHPSHRGERAHLLVTLLRHARRAASQVTILSGDVHVGARGRVVATHPELCPGGRPEGVLHQVTSSGIINFAPRWYELLLLRLATDDDRDSPLDGVYTQMLDVTGDEQLLLRRNWLSVVFDEQGQDWPSVRMWLKWYTEQGGVEPQVVVEALPPEYRESAAVVRKRIAAKA